MAESYKKSLPLPPSNLSKPPNKLPPSKPPAPNPKPAGVLVKKISAPVGRPPMDGKPSPLKSGARIGAAPLQRNTGANNNNNNNTNAVTSPAPTTKGNNEEGTRDKETEMERLRAARALLFRGLSDDKDKTDSNNNNDNNNDNNNNENGKSKPPLLPTEKLSNSLDNVKTRKRKKSDPYKEHHATYKNENKNEKNEKNEIKEKKKIGKHKSVPERKKPDLYKKTLENLNYFEQQLQETLAKAQKKQKQKKAQTEEIEKKSKSLLDKIKLIPGETISEIFKIDCGEDSDKTLTELIVIVATVEEEQRKDSLKLLKKMAK